MNKKCTVCGGELEGGKWSGGAYLDIVNENDKGVLMQSIKTKPYICKKCGHVEVFKEE